MQNSSKNIECSPPSKHELEISLFGPGIGECIVAHLGDGNWMVVDSCLNHLTKKPIALDYLKSIGVDYSSIKLLVISHWHNDHIRGASEIVEKCPAAKISLPNAFLEKEFLSLIASYSGIDEVKVIDRETSGTKELAKIVKLFRMRCGNNTNYKSQNMALTGVDRILYNAKETEVRALSPSDKATINSLKEISLLIPKFEGARRVLPRPTQNANAIVLWIKFDDVCILLGSDLEETDDPDTGWSAIIDSSTRPDGKASIFKIPHHGSETSHSDDVWKYMVDSAAESMLTCKIDGKTPLPKEGSVMHLLKKHTTNLYCTNNPINRRTKRNPTAEKLMKSMVKKRKKIGGEMGQIQIRMSKEKTTKIGIKPPATKMIIKKRK